jgi:hypothetical protein
MPFPPEKSTPIICARQTSLSRSFQNGHSLGYAKIAPQQTDNGLLSNWGPRCVPLFAGQLLFAIVYGSAGRRAPVILSDQHCLRWVTSGDFLFVCFYFVGIWVWFSFVLGGGSLYWLGSLVDVWLWIKA